MGEMAFATPKKQVIVGPEDTVYGIAYNHGISTRTLIAANNLKPPFVLKVAQVLIIPGASEHIVGDGESLQDIAENYGVNIDVLAQENNLKAPFFVTPGTSLSIPSRDTEPMGEALQQSTSQEISTSSLAPLPLIKSAPTPSKTSLSEIAVGTQGTVATLPDDLAAELALEKEAAGGNASSQTPLMGNLAEKKSKAPPLVSEEEKKEEPDEEKKPAKKVEKKEAKKEPKDQDVSFVWPVNGDVIRKFSPGGKSDGIDIKVEVGTPVKASADGTVMYAGSELKGFGNLLLIKHAHGWVTAYAHNAELLVNKGDKVKQGQAIAKSGLVDGDATKPQLHFEIRKVKQLVDPMTKLGS